jgi:hypothetical protein
MALERGCKLCLPFISVFGENKMAEIRRRDFENQSLPEGKKHETIFTLYSYGKPPIVAPSKSYKTRRGTLLRKRISVIRPAHSGIMFLSQGELLENTETLRESES